MGATITVNVTIKNQDPNEIAARIRSALESVTSEPVTINITASEQQVDNNAISVYNREKQERGQPR